jgi:hypothetical protein
MTNRTPSETISASTLQRYYRRPHVYAWRRGAEYLYVGLSILAPSRFMTHHILNHAEPYQPADVIDLYACETFREAIDLEAAMIASRQPKYNTWGKES